MKITSIGKNGNQGFGLSKASYTNKNQNVAFSGKTSAELIKMAKSLRNGKSISDSNFTLIVNRAEECVADFINKIKSSIGLKNGLSNEEILLSEGRFSAGLNKGNKEFSLIDYKKGDRIRFEITEGTSKLSVYDATRSSGFTMQKDSKNNNKFVGY